METITIRCNVIFMKVETGVLLLVNIKIVGLWEVMPCISCIYLCMLLVSQTV
jgi:hypothetical protein